MTRNSFIRLASAGLLVLTFVACSSPVSDRDLPGPSRRDGGVSQTIPANCSGGDAGMNGDAGDESGDAGVECTCPSGYVLDGEVCELVNLCEANNGGCSANATCTPGVNSRICSCKQGYTGDGITCTPKSNSCDGCHAQATCEQNAEGSRCVCKPGYKGDGITCTLDMAVCETCSSDASCKLVDGAYQCVCKDGFAGDGQTCRIACQNDSVCPTGQRCCAAKGSCHPIVGSGAECDCEHPCPESQGCFPGTCGETPYRCRPGCFPGDASTVADTCSPTSTGTVTYCNALPADQRTPENKGGACAPGDNCSVTTQNCPDLPLDRTQPVSASNPVVPHTCEPVSPTATACRPAGAKGVDAQNCEYDTCGDTTNACVKGLICVGLLDDPSTPTRCAKQCSNPSDFPVTSPECGSGYYCLALYGAGREKFKSGVCMKP